MPGRPTLISIAACGLLLAACSDSRISYDEFREIERDLTAERQAETVNVQPAEFALTEIKPQTVRPGDVLTLTLRGVKEDSYSESTMKVRVHDDGRIALPVVGRIDVNGLTLEMVENAIYVAHVPNVVKEMSVFAELSGPEATTVMVNGAAAQRGLVTLASNERNLLYALARSGGFAPSTSGRVKVHPVRGDREPAVYDLANLNDVRRVLMAPPLESGDVVTVEPAQTSAVYVTGLVNSPGPVALPPESSLPLTRVIATAGGPVDFVGPKEATLVRTLADGRAVRVKLAMADILNGMAPDVDLHPGDILDVPHTAGTRWRSWVLNNIRFGPWSIGSQYDPVAQWRFNQALDEDNNNFGNSVLDTVRYGLPNVVVPPVLPPAAAP